MPARSGGSGVYLDPMAARRRACSGAAGDQEDTPGGTHLAVLHPGTKGFLDGGERPLTSMVVGVPERLADSADPDAGQGDFGYPALTDHHMIGVRRYGNRTESGRIQHGADLRRDRPAKTGRARPGRASAAATR